MQDRWPGVLLILALLIPLALAIYEARHWKQLADLRGWQAEQAYQFLAKPAATDQSGHTFTNADVLQDVVRQRLAK